MNIQTDEHIVRLFSLPLHLFIRKYFIVFHYIFIDIHAFACYDAGKGGIKVMEHKHLSRLLILAGILAAIGCAFIFLVLIPIGGRAYYVNVPQVRALYWPSLIYFWLIGVLCAGALWQYMCICRRIGQNRSFCADNVQRMKRIAQLLFVCAAMLVVYCAVSLHPAVPFGPQLMACVIVAMAFCAMGMLAWALHKLLHRAVSLQEENDLTI